MVFTCRVRIHRPAPVLTRRTALAGLGAVGAAVALAGCTHHQTASTAHLVGSDPLGPLYTETTALVDTYDRIMAATPELVPRVGQLREECRQHATALAALIGMAAPAISPGPDPTGTVAPSPSTSAGTPPPASPSPPPPSPAPLSPSASPVDPTAAARAELSAAEKSAQLNAATACLAAPAARVAVLASIAACRATHVAALR